MNVFRTSYAQERLWFLEQVAAGSAAYNVVGAFEAEGRLDVAALRTSLAAVVARHEALRTTFVAMDGRPMQVVSPTGPIGFVVRDLGGAASTDLRIEVEREAMRPFDVARGPLVRMCVLVVGPERHVVALTMHHLVADAWSIGILVGEICALYRAAGEGRAAMLPPPRLQYADYSEWQRRRAGDGREDAQLRYWRTQLAAAPYPAVAAGDRLRFRGAVERCELGSALGAAVRETARRAAVTPFGVALAAWTIVLGRFAGLEDVTVLVPVANRERTELGDVVGFFVNLVALRLQLDRDPTLAEVLRRVGAVVREGLRHQTVPFELVLGTLGVDRTLARPPLSPFAFALEQAIDRAVELPEVRLRTFPVETHAARTDLALTVREHGASVEARLEYDRSLYAAAEAARLVGDFRVVLEALVSEQERPLSTLLPAARLACEEAPPATTVWDGFLRQAERRPDAVAVRAGTRTVTYRELRARARRIAGGLIAGGVERDHVVGVLAERGIEWIAGMLGVWGAGAVYLPLDPRWPAARLRALLERSGARLALTGDVASARLADWARKMPDRRTLPLEGAERWGDGAVDVADAWTAAGPAADAVAYVLFTSGSTGTPKGALIEHRGLANHLAAKIDLLGLDPGDRVAQTAPASFDVSLWQCAAVLLVGGEVVVMDDATVADPTAFRAAIAHRGVTIVELVPSVLRLVLDAEEADRDPGFASLRWLVVTGEALPPELCRRWLARHPNVPLVNAYGPTECADDVTHHVVRTPPPLDAVRVPIGRPIPGMAVEVLDEALQPVPCGMPGELCVAGVGVGRGYLGDPERTAAAFVTSVRPDGSAGPRLYRTGDRGRRLPDGSLEWLGRLDTQVKLRGVRIEPEEVEVVLLTHPDVRVAAVLAEPANAPTHLVAYVETDREPTALAERLRAWLAERLPEAMVPARIVARGALPTTPNGKLDRRALETCGAVTAAADGRAPETPAERLLATLWREVLGVEVGSVNAGFFALGGDSLATIRLVAAGRRQGLVFTPQQVFEHPTIAALAAVATPTAAPPAEQGLVVGDLVPTPIQRLFLAAGLPRPDHYNMAMLLAVAERLAPASLAIAVEHLLRHHDALRLRVRRDGGQWRATIAGIEGPVPYAHVDLSALGDDAAAAAIEATAAETQTRLDLARGPIVRVVSFDLGPGRASRLSIVVHHLACDAASWPILLEDLATVYAQVEGGEPIALAPKTSSYRAWADAVDAYGRSAACRDEATFWDRECASPGVRVPRRAAGESPAIADLATVTVEVTADVTARLLAVTARRGVTAETALLAAFVTAITCGDPSKHALVYLERHGREPVADGVDVARTVGWFTAVFPVCIRVAASGRAVDTLVEIERHLRSVPRGGVPWCALGNRRGVEGVDPSVRPEVSCNFLGRIDPPAGLPWRIAPESPGPEVGIGGTRPTTLDVVGAITNGTLRTYWHYDAVAYARADVTALANDCAAVLCALANDAADEAVADILGRAS